jgi:putative NADPH-quinone reductase
MKVLVVIGHQNTNKDSFCHAIAQTAIEECEKAGHQVVYHDLYDETFDPVMPQCEVVRGGDVDPAIQGACDEVLDSDAYIVVHPNWWAQPPAILKGWIDRVFRQGQVYEFGDKGAIIGHLAGKKAIVFTTSNTPRDVELEVYGDPLENLWRTCIFGFCGLTDFHRRNFESIVMSTAEQRAQWLSEVREIVMKRLC